MRRKILPFILGGALSIAAVAPVGAQSGTLCEVQETNRGGVAGLAALIAANVQANVGVTACDIDVLNNSLNNLLRNADIDILNNVLNNSLNNVLRNAEIIKDVEVNVLSGEIDVTLIDDSTFTIHLPAA